MAGLSLHLLGYVFNRIFTELGLQGVSYFGVVWTQTFGTFSHPLNIAWMSLACDDSEERALAMAMVIMFANIAGIAGAQIFRSDDAPKYRRGFSINIAILAVGLALAAVRFVDDKFWRREKVAQIQEQLARENESTGDEKSDGHRDVNPTLGLEKTSPAELNPIAKPTQ
jgi:hypothetical protein